MPQGKVAIVIRQLKKTSGAARNALEQIRLFHALGYNVTVIGDVLDIELIHKNHAQTKLIWKLPLNSNLQRQFFAWRAQNYIKKNKFDFVIGHGDIYEQDVLCLHNLVHLQSELVHEKPLDVHDDVGLLHEKLIRGQKYKVLVANSHLMRDDLVKRFGIPHSKIEICYQSYSREQFNTKNKSEIRAKMHAEIKTQYNFEIAKGDVVVGLITSGEFKVRGLDTALKVLSDLCKRHSIKFLVAGKDRDIDTYKKMAADLKVPTCFLEHDSQVEKYYHSLDVFFLPARFETFARSALEAMACGLPVLVSKNTGISEVIQSKQLVKPPNDINGWINVLDELLTNHEWRKTICKQNAERALLLDEMQYRKRFHQIIEKLKL